MKHQLTMRIRSQSWLPFTGFHRVHRDLVYWNAITLRDAVPPKLLVTVTLVSVFGQ
jgi:hypothetical protein